MEHAAYPRIFRVSTGIEELDQALEGGVPKGSWVAITGEPGTGKSILCMHYAYRGLQEGDPVIYVTTEAEFRDVIRQAEQFGMNFEEYEIHYLGGESPVRKPQIVVIDIFSLLKMARQLSSELGEGERKRRYAALDIDTLIAAITEAYQVLGLTTERRRTPLRHVRLVIDSLSAFWADKPVMARKYSYNLKIATHRENVTAYLVSQYAMTTKSVNEDEVIEVMSGGSITKFSFKELSEYLGLSRYAASFTAAIPLSYEVRVRAVRSKHGVRPVWTPLKALIRHEIHEELYEVELSSGDVIRLTRDHGILKLVNDGSLSYVRTESLRRGDVIAIVSSESLRLREVRNISTYRYNGYVYDVATELGNFIVNNAFIIHNSTFGFGLEHIADGVIHLWMDNVEDVKEVRRYLIVKKMRMTNHYTGAFKLEIVPGRGVVLTKI